MGIAYNTSIVRDGLVLHLDAANVKSYPGSGTTWFDLSGYNNDISLLNTPTWDSSGFTFNGTNQYGTINSNSSLTFSRPSIFMVSTIGTGTALAKGGYGSYWNYGFTGLTSTYFRIRNTNGDYSSNIYSATQGLNIYGGTHDGTNRNYYLNGKYLGQNTGGYSPSASNTLYLRIGCAWSNSAQSNVEFFNGKISLISIYNRELNSTEIQQNFEALRGRYGI